MKLENTKTDSRRNVALGILFFCVVLLTDQTLKSWALSLGTPAEILGLKFYPVGNSGVFGGFLADLDPWIIRIFFTVLFGFLCVGTALTMHFLRHKPVPFLKLGLIVYVSGIFGNVIDRMKTGVITDYILIPTGNGDGMAVNFADVMVFFGFILILLALFRESEEFWFRKNKRQGLWLEPRFQLHFGLLTTFVGFAHFFVIALYSYVYLNVFITTTESIATLGAERIIRDYLFGLFVIEGAAILLSFSISIIVSHRLVGPIVALEHFLRRKLAKDDTSALRLRRSDYFRGRLTAIADLFSKAKNQSNS